MKKVFSLLFSILVLTVSVPAYAFVDSSTLGDLNADLSALTAQNSGAPSVYKMTYTENFVCLFGCGPATAQYVFTNVGTGETKTSYIMSGGVFLPATTLTLSDSAKYTTLSYIFTCPPGKKIASWAPQQRGSTIISPTNDTTITLTACTYSGPCYVTCQ